MTGIDWTQLEADREAGTPGPFSYRIDTYSGDCGVTARGCSVVIECFADIRHAGEMARSEAIANARRIARLPALEAYALAAREKLEAAERLAAWAKAITERKVSPATGGRLVLERDIVGLETALAAYRAAGEGEE